MERKKPFFKSTQYGGEPPPPPDSWAYAFAHKFDYKLYCPDDGSDWDQFWCDAGVFFRGCGLFLVQYGTLPVIILGSAKLVEFLHNAES